MQDTTHDDISFAMAPGQTSDSSKAPAFTAQLSQHWLLERTYHVHLDQGKQFIVSSFTEAMGELVDFAIPLPTQSWKSRFPPRLPIQRSHSFSIPIATWLEVTQQEAKSAYQQNIPVLLCYEQIWERMPGYSGLWSANHNMRAIITGDGKKPSCEPMCGATYAVCYVDRKQGIFSNALWKMRFSSDPSQLFNTNYKESVIFLCPSIQFPFSTHYTVVAANGEIMEYVDQLAALEGFTSLPLQEFQTGDVMCNASPYFCHYHDVTCVDGVYRIEFFGPGMNEQGYKLL